MKSTWSCHWQATDLQLRCLEAMQVIPNMGTGRTPLVREEVCSKDSHVKVSVRQNESRSRCSFAVHSLCSSRMAKHVFSSHSPLFPSLQSTVRTKRDTVKGYFLAGGNMVWWPVSSLWFNSCLRLGWSSVVDACLGCTRLWFPLKPCKALCFKSFLKDSSSSDIVSLHVDFKLE